MKALSLWEPWASLIATGAKTYETRSWSTNYRGELLICAAKRHVKYEIISLLSTWNFQGGLAPLVGKPLDLDFKTWPGVRACDLNFGMAVAIVNLVDCKRTEDITLGEIAKEITFGDFSKGRYGWKLELIKRIDPFSVEGKQGFFNVDIGGVLRRICIGDGGDYGSI